jgi:hypothetical protein
LASDFVQYNPILNVIIIQEITDNAVALLTTSHKLGANVSRVILRSDVSGHCFTHCDTLSNAYQIEFDFFFKVDSGFWVVWITDMLSP